MQRTSQKHSFLRMAQEILGNFVCFKLKTNDYSHFQYRFLDFWENSKSFLFFFFLRQNLSGLFRLWLYRVSHQLLSTTGGSLPHAGKRSTIWLQNPFVLTGKQYMEINTIWWNSSGLMKTFLIKIKSFLTSCSRAEGWKMPAARSMPVLHGSRRAGEEGAGLGHDALRRYLMGTAWTSCSNTGQPVGLCTHGYGRCRARGWALLLHASARLRAQCAVAGHPYKTSIDWEPHVVAMLTAQWTLPGSSCNPFPFKEQGCSPLTTQMSHFSGRSLSVFVIEE